MQELLLTDEIVDRVKVEAIDLVKDIMGVNLVQVILYGSCARGDFTDDSDIDIALLINCDRMEAKKYEDGLASAAAKLAMKYFAIVNFVSIPYEEFMEKRDWYAYFRNIEMDGIKLYGLRESNCQRQHG